MRIDAICCCVGQEYASYLSKSLPVWLDTLDSLVIVTRTGDEPTLRLASEFSNRLGFRVIETDVFGDYGASFNKGAALNYAVAASEPLDWALHFDADIEPPAGWRAVVEREARLGRLHGAVRVNEDGSPHDDPDKRFWPYGYFQLWHVNDTACWQWPLYDTWHAHAGSYDADFGELWPKGTGWQKLPFNVIHRGESRANWFGAGNREAMKPLLDYGLYKYRIDSKLGKVSSARLPIPEPQMKLRLECTSRDHVWARNVLRACAIAGPFRVQARYSRRPIGGFRNVNPRHKWEALQAEILGL